MRAWLTPRMLGAHLLALAAVGVAGTLGLWQFGSWQERRTAEAADLTHETPVPLADVMAVGDPFLQPDVGRPVTVEGTWLPDATVLISGREHDGADGYWVVTPLLEDGSADAALPIVRGWTASPDDVPPAPTGAASITGWLQPPEGSGGVDDDPGDDVYPELRVADLVQRLEGDVYSAYAVVDPDAEAVNAGGEGLEPADLQALPQVGRFTAVRNFLYGIEWWVFGGFAALIWWRFVREESQTPQPPATADPVASGA